MTTIQVRISEDFKLKAQNISKAFGVSLSDLVRMAMLDFVEREKQPSGDIVQKKEFLKMLSRGNKDKGFHRLSDQSIDHLITSFS